MLRQYRWIIIFLILACFIFRNIPWNLDNFDQAKQAYTSFEIVKQNHWWLQHSPKGQPALKPPLLGWVSAILFNITHSWNFAWRFPPFVASIVIGILLWKESENILSKLGGIVGISAYGFNLLTPHLSTLVDTNIVLAMWVFLLGWLFYKHIQNQNTSQITDSDTQISSRDRYYQLYIGIVVLGGLLTKGPTLFAFILPGILLYQLGVFVCKKQKAEDESRPQFKSVSGVWGGVLPWLIPTIVFLIWVAGSFLTDPSFGNEVIFKEFLGRFISGDGAVHKSQPIYFYAIHLLDRFALWSLLIVILACFSECRRTIAKHPENLWLACWVIGGFVLMSVIPSKRVDRIFPIIPPLCLLLVVMIKPLWLNQSAWAKRRCNAILGIAVVITFLFCAGNVIANVLYGFKHGGNELQKFCHNATNLSSQNNLEYQIVNPLDEGLLLYTDKLRVISFGDAINRWNDGSLKALMVDRNEQWRFEQAKIVLETKKNTGHANYVFIRK